MAPLMDDTPAAPSTPFAIPAIDISPYLSDPSSRDAASVVQSVRDACVSTGFFQIVGHGVPSEVIQGAFAASRAYYALPLEEKAKLDIKKQVGFRGYDGIGTQSYGTDTLPDLKESFFVGHDCPPTDPRHGRLLTGPNVWPSETAVSPSVFREPVEKYYSALLSLCLKIFDILASTLPYGPDVFKAFVSDMPAAPMRMLHYPPQAPVARSDKPTSAKEKKQLGASAHTDFGAITLLLQDRVPGLQVLHPDAESGDSATEKWVPVPPRADAFVVNLGDMMTRWTQGAYKSSVHRVLNDGGEERYSIAFFFDGNIDTRLDPLDGSEGDGVTVEGHMLECLKKSYGPKE